jgi:hypothetical protein
MKVFCASKLNELQLHDNSWACHWPLGVPGAKKEEEQINLVLFINEN